MSISKDLVAGLLFLFIGLGAMALSSQYSFGSLNNLGAGLFPFILGCALTLLSIPIVAKAILRGRSIGDIIEFNPAEARPLLAVLGSSLLFAILIERAGLFIARRYDRAGRRACATQVAPRAGVGSGWMRACSSPMRGISRT